MKGAMRIGLFGPSGTGKTKIAGWISKNYGIENLNLSGKHLLWDEMDITSHKDIISRSASDPDWGSQYQGNLSAGRIMELDKRVHSYVTDRTPLDSIVYMLLQTSMYLTNEDVDNFIKNNVKACKEYYTHLLAFPILTPPVSDDKRIANYRYQQMVDSIYKHVLQKFLIPYLDIKKKPKLSIIGEWDWDKRIEEIRQIISPFKLKP